MKGSHKGESRKMTNFFPLIFLSLCSSIGVLNWFIGFIFSLLIVKVHLLIPNKSSSIRIMAHLKVIVTTFLAHSIHFKFSFLYAHLKKFFLDFLSTIKDNAGSDLESRSWYSGLNQASGIMLFRYGPPIFWVMESNEQWQRDDYHWYGKWTLKWQERSNRNIRKCVSAQREREALTISFIDHSPRLGVNKIKDIDSVLKSLTTQNVSTATVAICLGIHTEEL